MFILPYSCNQPRHRFSWMAHGLVLSNVVATLAIEPSVLPTATGLFRHAAVAQLAANALILSIVARPLEWRLGRLRLLALYVVAGTAASFAAPGLAAPGAIAGLVGAYVVLFPRARTRFVYWVIALAGVSEATTFWLVALWAADQALALHFLGEACGAGLEAQLAGLGTGAAAGLVLSLRATKPAHVLEHEARPVAPAAPRTRRLMLASANPQQKKPAPLPHWW